MHRHGKIWCIRVLWTEPIGYIATDPSSLTSSASYLPRHLPAYPPTHLETDWLRKSLMIVGPDKFKIHRAGGRLETQAGFMYCSFEAVFLLLWETSVFALRAFNRLDEAHLHQGEYIRVLQRNKTDRSVVCVCIHIHTYMCVFIWLI